MMGTSGRLPSADADGEALELGSNLPHSTMALEQLSAPLCFGVDVHAICPMLQVGSWAETLARPLWIHLTLCVPHMNSSNFPCTIDIHITT